MADSTTTSEPSPLTGPSSFGSAADAQGLPTVHEVPSFKPDHDFHHVMIPESRSVRLQSRDASFDSSMDQNGAEKPLEEAPQSIRYTAPAHPVQETWIRPNGTPGSPDYRRTMADPMKPTLARKPKRGGLRNTIRRIFGRKNMKDRISMPTPTAYTRHNPDEFITTAEDVKKERSASVPAGQSDLLRTSGLSSHPPSKRSPKLSPQRRKSPEPPVPPPPERQVPERPPRPRRASVPSVILNRDEIQAVTAAMTGMGMRNSQEQDVDARNIGFAVTNGSNPRRRSRSVGAVRQSDHRMSPIQWRHWRTRSDEIKYLRQSNDLGSFGLKHAEEVAQNEDGVADEEPEVAVQTEDFNFNIPPEERMGLEERLFTLELKLMDFEHAISKFQASSAPPSRRDSRLEEKRKDFIEGYPNSDVPHASVEASPVLSHDTPRIVHHKFSSENNSWQTNPRPTSVAATLKPATTSQNAYTRKNSIEYGTRSTLPGLTVEHYTTLVTLIRHEQSARVRLEEQVCQLQKQIEQLSPPDSSHSRQQFRPPHSHTFSHSSSQRRRGMVDIGSRGGGSGGHYFGQPHHASSSDSVNDTDTDDDAYHDVYVTPDVTPVERGEYERGAFERVSGIQDGVAF